MFYLLEWKPDDASLRDPNELTEATLIWINDEGEEDWNYKNNQEVKINFSDDTRELICFNSERLPYSVPIFQFNPSDQKEAILWIDEFKDRLDDTDVLSYLDYESSRYERYCRRQFENLVDYIPAADSYDIIEYVDGSVISEYEECDPVNSLIRMSRRKRSFLEVYKTKKSILYAKFKNLGETVLVCFIPIPSPSLIYDYERELQKLNNLGIMAVAEEWESFRMRFTGDFIVDFPSHCFEFGKDEVKFKAEQFEKEYGDLRMMDYGSSSIEEYIAEVLGGDHEYIQQIYADFATA